MNKDEKKITSGNHLLSITGSLPFDGRWIVGATPDKKIPSHGNGSVWCRNTKLILWQWIAKIKRAGKRVGGQY